MIVTWKKINAAYDKQLAISGRKLHILVTLFSSSYLSLYVAFE